MLSRRPSASLVVSIIAVFFAVSGASMAAGSYIIQSKHQIKPSVIHALTTNHLTTVTSSPTTVAAGERSTYAVAACPTGYTVTGGGFETGFDYSNPNMGDHTSVISSSPVSNQWVVQIANDGSTADTFSAYAVCLQNG